MTTALPTRRVEAWKYSDLAAALPDVRLPEMAGGVIERLAGGADTTVVAPGENVVIVDRFERGGLDARARNVTVGAGGALVRIVLQTCGDTPLSAIKVRLEEGATFRQFVLADGARLARVETDVTVAGADATVVLNGLYLVAQGRHADLTSTVTHAVAGGVTRQLVKGAARAGGRGVFQGKILVQADAQKTDAQQNHHALLLEDGAEVFAKPELEIHADDVACAHGNTIGGLDPMALFYLRARGLPESEARALLVEAFVCEAVPEDLPREIDAEVRGRIAAWLGGAP